MAEWINGILVDDDVVSTLNDEPTVTDITNGRATLIWVLSTAELSWWARRDDVLYKCAFVSALLNLEATGGIGQVELTWDAMPAATSYRIQRSDDGINDWVDVDTTSNTNLTDTGLDDVTTYYYRGRIDAPVVGPYCAPVSADTAEPLLTNLVAWYRNNGTDRSGNSNNLTATGGVATAAGITGSPATAMLFDNTSEEQDYTAALLLVSTAPASWQCWFRANDNFTLGNMLMQNSNSGLSSIALSDGDSTFAAMWGGPFSVSSVYDANTWYHVVVTTDGSLTRLYINGTLVDSHDQDTLNNTPPNEEFTLGNQYNGRMEFIGVWSRCLSVPDVTRLYASGNGFDPTA